MRSDPLRRVFEAADLGFVQPLSQLDGWWRLDGVHAPHCPDAGLPGLPDVAASVYGCARDVVRALASSTGQFLYLYSSLIDHRVPPLPPVQLRTTLPMVADLVDAFCSLGVSDELCVWAKDVEASYWSAYRSPATGQRILGECPPATGPDVLVFVSGWEVPERVGLVALEYWQVAVCDRRLVARVPPQVLAELALKGCLASGARPHLDVVDVPAGADLSRVLETTMVLWDDGDPAEALRSALALEAS